MRKKKQRAIDNSLCKPTSDTLFRFVWHGDTDELNIRGLGSRNTRPRAITDICAHESAKNRMKHPHKRNNRRVAGCAVCAVAWYTHHLVWRRAEAKQNKRHSPSACAREIASTPSPTTCWTLACPEETLEKKTMLHSVSGLATIMRSTSVERYA